MVLYAHTEKCRYSYRHGPIYRSMATCSSVAAQELCESRDGCPAWAPVPNKPTVSVDVKQHFNNDVCQHLKTLSKKNYLFVCLFVC